MSCAVFVFLDALGHRPFSIGRRSSAMESARPETFPSAYTIVASVISGTVLTLTALRLAQKIHQGFHEIAFCHDADQGAVGLGDRQAAELVLEQQVCGVG